MRHDFGHYVKIISNTAAYDNQALPVDRLRRLEQGLKANFWWLRFSPPQSHLARISGTEWCLSASPQGLCLSLAAGNLPRSGAS